ncbi:hypothetical protein [Actinomadura chibensis]|uniref:DUF892 family protein n=1 Tax=Actinomadura chibensis TaxID=392828 RepID=A0A5D0NUA8_9ACTN|nr:hypothetical protein [Actinomadura chibensis]TYB47967.1 hypothetical protein FXF69_01630 [Actinomadura chibensis]
MNKIGLLFRELHRSERGLAQELLRVSERHVADHEIHHIGRDLAAWSRRHLRELAEVGGSYGVHLGADPALESGLGSMLRERGGRLVAHHAAPGLLLLRDLREVHVRAAGVSVDWELLAQAAQALKDDTLLALAQRCHPDTLRQMRWANAHLKQLSPQILAG